MHILNLLPQRLDAGATPTFAGFLGTNGQSILGNSSGAWAITANGTNQNITLTPSGTGVTNLIGNNVSPLLLTKGTGAGGIVFSFNGSAYLSSILTSESAAAANCYMDLGVATGANTTTQQVLRLIGNGRALVGTTTDSGAVLQVGTDSTTTVAGGVLIGTSIGIFRSAANTLSISTAGTTALTLDSSQNATFAAAIQTVSVVGFGATADSSTFVGMGAGTTGRSSLRIPHGAAPTSPVNGDMWTTTAGLYVRINGATVGPLS